MARKKRITMMEQYRQIRAENPDAILFFRMGDFYETFYEDAAVVSAALDIALTARGERDSHGRKIPLAGFPHHALDDCLHKMIKAGHKVAVCEQIEDPKKAKGIVKRAVVRVVTPGTVTDPHSLQQKANNFIASLYLYEKQWGAAAADLSTGEFYVLETDSDETIATELARISPAEMTLPENFQLPSAYQDLDLDARPEMEERPAWEFDPETARHTLMRHFQTRSLDGFGCAQMPAAVGAAGALISYLSETQKENIQHITGLYVHSTDAFMTLDSATIRNLELIRSMRTGDIHGTLLHVLDMTLTPMGGRKLRRAVLEPLLNIGEIQARLDAVAELKENPLDLDELRTALKGVHDVERLIGRVGLGSANARDLRAMSASLRVLPDIKAEILVDRESSLLITLRDSTDACEDIADLINRAIHESPPAGLRDGGIIRDGYDQELDELRNIMTNAKDAIAELQEREREATGIQSLKVGFNQVFGYYIEVTKANLSKVPDHYMRKQTLANAERYLTEELKEFEEKALNAEERSVELEYDLFVELREKARHETARIQSAAAALANLDFLSTLAFAALRHHYAKPEIHDGADIRIRDGRHPVVEQLALDEGFVPNDTLLNCEGDQFHIVTGPNMSGKSTYLRQVALIALMAQMGSFVPASEASIGVVDRVFTRVGASDNLAGGQSTFLVEMNETANILHNATSKSLLILDEVGRGTSTFDGLSIAWAVSEHIIQSIGAKTLFATHYHELVELASHNPGARNYNAAASEDGETITFLRKIAEGAADESYGIQVARLAGLPSRVVSRAMDILEILERQELSVDGRRRARPRRAPKKKSGPPGGPLQMSLFVPPSSGEPDPALKALREAVLALEVDKMTPIEALNALHQLRKQAEPDE